MAALATFLAAARATGTAPGIVTYSAEDARRRIAQGFRLISVGTELRTLRAAAMALVVAASGGSA